MARSPALFTKADVERAAGGTIAAALAAGLPIESVRTVVEPGRIVVTIGKAATAGEPADDLDQELANWSARNGQG